MKVEVETGTSVSSTVVRAVSEFRDCPVSSLPPLQETIDPDALNAFCAPKFDGTPREGFEVSFVYAGCHVTVEDGTHVTVTEVSR